jgi:hypothetical protein
MDTTSNNSNLTVARLVGAVDHPDFRESMALVRTTAQTEVESYAPPEVVLVAQSRPGQICQREIESLHRRWPLAGTVAILGSWCEGETRTGRPWPGVKRFYWHEFPAWWQQQVALRNAGHCPEWLRPGVETCRAPLIRNPKSAIRNRHRGLIYLSSEHRETAEALADVLHNAGYATVWNPPRQAKSVVRGAVAGIWDGGQLEDRELPNLVTFCRSLARDATPVVALLDFPRRDRCEVAAQHGVAAVLGKPWINANLVAAIDDIASRNANVATASVRAA